MDPAGLIWSVVTGLQRVLKFEHSLHHLYYSSQNLNFQNMVGVERRLISYSIYKLAHLVI